jgi:hypothetical protein
MTIFAGDAPALDRRDILDIPAEGGVFGAAFEEAFTTNPSTALYRMEDLTQEQEGRAVVMGPESYFAPNQARLEPDSPLMSAQDARDKIDSLGLKLTVPDQGIRTGALDVLIKRQQEQLARQQVLARAGSSFGTQLSAGLAASILDPINIASAFVPVVGEARYAAMLGRAATPLARAGVRAGVGAVEGAVGAAIIEPLPLLAARQDQTDYDLSDSLANIAFGAALGGGLHTIGGAVSDRLRRNIATETDIPPGGLGAGQVAEPIESISARSPSLATFDRAFDADPIAALKGTLARQLQDDQASLLTSAQARAVDEILPTLTGQRIGNVADLKAQRIGIDARLLGLDDTFKTRAKEFQGQGMSRKKAESAARRAIAVERDQLEAQATGIDATVDLNRQGELNKADLKSLERGVVPERLKPMIDARVAQIMEGYQQRPLGPAIQTAREKAETADWTVRESALKTAVSQAVTGRDIDVQHIFDLEDPSKAMMASESIRKGAPRSPDQIANNDSLRADDIVKSQKDDLDQAQADFDEEEALSTEMLKQLPEADRAAVEKAASAEIEASTLQAQKAEQYAKAYNAAAICDLRNGV